MNFGYFFMYAYTLREIDIHFLFTYWQREKKISSGFVSLKKYIYIWGEIESIMNQDFFFHTLPKTDCITFVYEMVNPSLGRKHIPTTFPARQHIGEHPIQYSGITYGSMPQFKKSNRMTAAGRKKNPCVKCLRCLNLNPVTRTFHPPPCKPLAIHYPLIVKARNSSNLNPKVQFHLWLNFPLPESSTQEH